MNISVLYNGLNISIQNECGHYKLSHGDKEQRCDVGELNDAIPDFARALDGEMKKGKKVLI